MSLTTPTRVAKAISVGARRSVTRKLSVVPSGATAVALDVTAAGGSAAGSLTVFPAGASRPGASTVVFAVARTLENAAIVQLGSSRSVTVYNSSVKAAHVSLDVSGYWMPSTAGQGSFGALTPVRQLNTGTGVGAKGALGAHRTLSFTASGGATGIPASASAVAVELTVKPTAAGYLTAFSAAGARPANTTMTYAAHESLEHLAIVPLSPSGRISIYNGSTGSMQLLGDVVGWFAAGDPTATGAYGVLTPYRVLSANNLGAHRSITIAPAGRGGVPKSGVRALALNVRVTVAAVKGSLVVDPGSPVSTSNLSFAKGQSVANLALARAPGGKVRVYNASSAAVKVSVDVSGYVLSAAIPSPTVSSSHYVRTTDTTVVADAGTTDAADGSTFVVLDVGAQSNDATGVVLSATSTKITYAALRNLIETYVRAYAARSSAKVTIAVATNNDGSFAKYTATQRGADWATKVVEPVRSSSTTPSTTAVVGADDIEPDGSSSKAQAQSWETAYLKAAVGKGDSTSRLYFVGSADGCPTAYGATGTTCDYGWTQAELFALAGGKGTGRIRALPQIYLSDQAAQWAGIEATGGSTAALVGALTEHATCPSASSSGCTFASFTAGEGFAAIYHAMSTLTSSPAARITTDLDVLS